MSSNAPPHAISIPDAVLATLARLASPKPKGGGAALDSVGAPCPHCGEPLTASTVRLGWIVPPVHGPATPRDGSDRYALCGSCSTARGARDLLEDPPTGAAGRVLLERRDYLLRSGVQHVTCWRDRPHVTTALDARVAQPRGTLAASLTPDGGALLGWSERSGGPAALGSLVHLLRISTGAQHLEHGVTPAGVTLLQVPPGRGLDAIWSVIEAGALVLPAQPAALDVSDWRTAWSLHWVGLAAHLDRIDRTTLWPVPLPARVQSMNREAARKRAQRAKKAAA